MEPDRLKNQIEAAKEYLENTTHNFRDAERKCEALESQLAFAKTKLEELKSEMNRAAYVVDSFHHVLQANLECLEGIDSQPQHKEIL